MSVRAIVLAAGQGTRMKSERPKVVHEAAGRPLVGWVLDAALGFEPDEVVVVVGHGADEVEAVLPDGVRTAVQAEQLGTGHAVMAALGEMGDVSADTVVVLPGDSPLLRSDTLAALVAAHRDGGHEATLLTAVLDDPFGYGRVIRDGERVVGIVEERDADESQRAIQEVGVSTYVFSGDALVRGLRGIDRSNAQGEYYLTDVIGVLASSGRVGAMAVGDPVDTSGVNSHDQLAEASAELRRRINHRWMLAGVWMQDPATTYIDAGVELEAGVRLYAGVHLEGTTTVGAGAEIGPDTFVRDSEVRADARIWYSVVRGAVVGEGATVGPYASLRAGTFMGPESKVGTFAETKQTTLGRKAKVPHLSYMGDATVGDEANIGAGTITCNYDGVHKHRTVIGDRAFIGSDTMLVAPVEIGDEAYTGAGSVITRDVPPGSLAVERSAQKEIKGYARRRARVREAEDS
ncbi:MAG: bifunctional UDP-N-acetylglucosamine diphosphorylase/glucosamine-1-phosphate N-acetyltransferase GlmU [Acidimicrobiia bacterium]|nr:bifunctional UDP-N-acetylglucosamine diphosphorylase/glucosamine-1-phosphate N-acetyltransferase GlmU [Acidimicrobiia bacterium]